MFEDFVTVDDMAAMHSVAPNTIYRILRADEDKPEAERRIPGAQKLHNAWWIPRDAAQEWKRSNRGRPSDGEQE